MPRVLTRNTFLLIFFVLFTVVAGTGAGWTEESEPTASPEELIRPDDTEAFPTSERGAAILDLWEHRRKEAWRKIDDWMDEEKSSAQPWLVAARVCYLEKRYKRSLKMAQRALDKAPQNPAGYYWRGRAFEAMDKPLEAVNEYRAALMAQENFVQAREGINRVTSLLKSSQSIEASSPAAP